MRSRGLVARLRASAVILADSTVKPESWGREREREGGRGRGREGEREGGRKRGREGERERGVD